MTAMTAWDARAFARALALAALALLLAWLVTAATDEGGVPWGTRAGRALPLTPVCAALGAWLALAPGRARGDLLGLAALGRAPWQVGGAAVGGGAALALAASLVVAAVPATDVSGFYPVAGRPTAYVYDAERATFADPARGVRIERDGRFTRILPGEEGDVPAPPDAVPRGGRAAAAVSMALAGIALPVLAALVILARASAVRAVALVFVAGAAGVVVFHAAAAHRVPALAATLPAAALVAVAAGLAWHDARGRAVRRPRARSAS
jgi:hypothetical protein